MQTFAPVGINSTNSMDVLNASEELGVSGGSELLLGGTSMHCVAETSPVDDFQFFGTRIRKAARILRGDPAGA